MDTNCVSVTTTDSAAQTSAAGAALAACLQAGDIILLTGDLGAGKTQFVQGAAAGLGARETPTSPTFNIVLSYSSGRMPLHHFDLYRLEDEKQLEDIGLREYLESDGACFVEWAERFPRAFDEFLSVRIGKRGEDERVIEACASGARAEELLACWRARLGCADGDKAACGAGGSVFSTGCVTDGDRPAAGPGEPGRDGAAERGHGGAGELGAGDVGVPGRGGAGEPECGDVAGAACGDADASGRGSAPAAKPDGARMAGGDGAVLAGPDDEAWHVGDKGGGASAASPRNDGAEKPVVLAFDTANEVVAIGVAELDAPSRSVRILRTLEVQAHRASNTQLLPRVDELLAGAGIGRARIACVCVGRGPGSFTGVRIAMATAKGIASALGVGLVGVSSLDAVAWHAQSAGVRGNVLVVADAMRKEVYPVLYRLDDAEAVRLTADRVVKAQAFAEEFRLLAGDGCAEGQRAYTVMGDALVKYGALLGPLGAVTPERLWAVSGRGLLLALQATWRDGACDPLDAPRHDSAFALPVYTRLSDAEENERVRLARTEEKNLVTGVQDPEASRHRASERDGGRVPGAMAAAGRAERADAGEAPAGNGAGARATMHELSKLVAPPDERGISFHPLDAGHVGDVAALESRAMGSDAWGERLVADELAHRNRSWWVAECAGQLVGYAGGMVVDGDVQVLKVAVDAPFRRRGIARELLQRVVADARNLGAQTCSLEVRASNEGAQAFYESLGLETVGVRPRYYSDREDAVIMQGPLPGQSRDVAGMELRHLSYDKGCDAMSWRVGPNGEDADAGSDDARVRPLILAIESSCDETAAAVVDGSGGLLSDVVASQIDFHARFGGVVPEIASRKHIEAICGVCEEALATAAGVPVRWRDLDAVAVTYAPGLVGALVVGVAFAKGAAWALDVPFIGVNHLEGHLYANKIGAPDFEPPAVVSLVSGGNTMLVHMRGWGDYQTLGATIDDAVGEAFDKVAKALGLGYPGGPVISRQAAQGDPDAIDFPRAMLHSHDLRFSLSGLKTAVVNYINRERQAGRELNIPDIAASFQQAVVDVQVAKAKMALQQTGARTFCLGGGVAANPVLRAAYERLCARMGVRLVMPPLSSCGDNAGMIALVALDRYRQGKFFGLDADAYAHADLDEAY